ncbi:MAG: hypothetical protein HYV26_04690 [Candidatus Hydrogenedentes bacterium]|nr:hypothetical protein [Candidatus Hydrogenedentota bacterium]
MANEERSVESLLYQVFDRAKRADEFQFAVAIIPVVRGLPPYGMDDPLRETEIFVHDMLGLMNAPLEYMTRLRLGLMAYVHMMECKPAYEELSNILWIMAGGNAVPEPFGHLYEKGKNGRIIPPSARRIVNFLICQAKGVDEPVLADELESMFNDSIRNAVVHSDYFFHKGQFQTDWRRQGNPVKLVNGISLEELSKIIVRGAQFFEALRSAAQTHRRSYKHPKLVIARIDGQVNQVALLANESWGLYGVDGRPDAQLIAACTSQNF